MNPLHTAILCTPLSDPTKNGPTSELEVDPARLFHHYYLDTRGYASPNPDSAQFEHLALFLPCQSFGYAVTDLASAWLFAEALQINLAKHFAVGFYTNISTLRISRTSKRLSTAKPAPTLEGILCRACGGEMLQITFVRETPLPLNGFNQLWKRGIQEVAEAIRSCRGQRQAGQLMFGERPYRRYTLCDRS